MTQGRLKTSKVRSAKAKSRKATANKAQAASRKKSAANRAPKGSRNAKSSGASKKVKVDKKVDAKSSPRGRSVAPAPAVATPVAGAKQAKKLKQPRPRRPVQLGLGFDDTQDTLAVLHQQNRRLMLKIAKKRASLMLLRQLSDELMQQASQRVLPYREELKALTRELLDLESRVLGAEKLVGRKRDQVRLAFHELLKGLPQDELDDEDDDNACRSDGPDSQGYVKGAAAQSSSDGLGINAEARTSVAADAPGADSQADGAQRNFTGSPEGATSQRATAPGATKEAEVDPETRQPEARSADKPSGDQSGALRSLFKRLVIQWHPDRVRDDAQKAERTKLMKELTQAFEGGDLAKLVAMEQGLALKRGNTTTTPDTPEKQAEQLQRANAELVKQLAELQVSVEAVREDCPFTLDERKKDPASVARDELDQFVLMNHMAVQRATQARDFVLSFAQGKMRLTDFLQGPSPRLEL
jgi:hypothetical protein